MVEVYPYVPYIQYLLPGSTVLAIFVSAMIGVVLLQKSEGGALGMGGGTGFLSSRGSANVLTRTTAILARLS